MPYRKWVHISEVAAYKAYGWRVVVVASATPADYRPGMVEIESEPLPSFLMHDE